MAGTKLTFEVLSIDADETPHTPHLILPMEVDGEMLCPLYQGGRMTTAKVTNFHTYDPAENTAAITAPGSPWTGLERPGEDEEVGDDGEFTFGVACGGMLNCKWVYTDDFGETQVYGRVYVNGVDTTQEFGPGYDPSGTEGTFTIPLTCRPCGNLITIRFLADAYPG